MRPLARQLDGRVGRVRHDVLPLARGGRSLAFALDLHERLDEAVHFGLGLRLGGLDHQRLVHGERERRGVEPVVHQPVGDVAAVDAVLLLEVRQVEDHLVAHAARFACVVGAQLAGERRGHVVGIDDRHLGGAAQAVAAEHLDVAVGDRQQHRRAPRCRRYGRDALFAARRHERVRRQEASEVLGHADRTHARTAAPVGHGEGLVQVEVADVGADVARIRQADLGVHVRSVHVDLAAGVVHQVDDLADAALEDAVRRGVGHHQTGQLRTVLGGLGLQVVDVDVAVGVAGHRDDLHAGHRRRGGVRAVRRGGDQHHVAVALAAALVIGADDHQAGVFARGARVGLQRAGRHAGDCRQVLLQLRDHRPVAFGLVGRGEGVDVLESGQRKGLHEGCGVELHRARAERDHRVGERDVAQLQPLDVAHQGALGAVGVEYGFGQVGAFAAQSLRQEVLGGELHGLGLAAFGGGEDADHGLDLVGRRHLVERHAHAALRRIVEVDAAFEGQRLHDGRLGLDVERVEEGLGGELVVERLEGAGHGHGGPVGRFGGAAETFGAVVDAVEADHRGHQRRGGADVRGGLLAFDVLFAHLERHAQGAVAQTVHRDADDAAREVALEGFAGGHVAGARAAEAHRGAEALGRADGDVGAPLARSLEQREREQVGDGRDHRAPGVCRGGEGGVVAHGAVGGRILHDRAELAARKFVFVVFVDDQFDAERFAAREQHVECLGEDVAVDEELVAPLLDGLARAAGEHHQHRLGGRRALVEQRAVADLHPRQRDDGGLEVEQRLEAALRDLGLIGGVGGVPGGILEDVAHDGGRYGAGVVPHADERAQDAVAVGQVADVGGELVFAHPCGGQCEGLAQADGLRDDLGDELLDGADADRVEHRSEFGGVGDADVTSGKVVEHGFMVWMVNT